jgi:di/tricarboxylate transporter
MSPGTLLVLVILGAVLVLLATGRVRADLVALLALVAVSILGLAPLERTLGAFANPAVIAVAGMFVLSAGLSRTGVADWVGDQLGRWSGSGERGLVVATVLVSGALSGFINNVGVAAMMLPVTMRLSRRAGIAPSRLLIPMVLGAQLGGAITLIGTSANLLAADVLLDAGFEPFSLLSFAPIGGSLLVVGTVFLALAAPRVLPERTPRDRGPLRPALREDAAIEERFFRLVLPTSSGLNGKSLRESLIGPALGLHVLAVERKRDGEGAPILAPGPDTLLQSGDVLLVQGRPDFFQVFQRRRHLTAADEAPLPLGWLTTGGRALAEVTLREDDPLVGRTLHESDFRRSTRSLVLALVRAENAQRTHVQETRLEAGDRLLLQAPEEALEQLVDEERFDAVRRLDPPDAVRTFSLEERLWTLRVTSDSLLDGRRLEDARLGDAVGIVVLAVGRSEAVILPDGDTRLEAGDVLLVKSRPEDLRVLRALQRLELKLDVRVEPAELESDQAGFIDVVLAPRSTLIGRTLRQIGFRRRFGMHVVAVVREGRTIRSNLRDRELRFGDALLLYGPRRRVRALAREPDLILLEDPGVGPPNHSRAPRALAVVGVALLPVVAGWVPVPVGVLLGAVLMVLSRCLTADEAYRAVEWPVVVLVAGMLALGAALDATGTAALAGSSLLAALGDGGPWMALMALVVLSTLAAQILPGPAVVVLLGPVAVAGATSLGVLPHAFVAAVAITSTSLASPLAQPSLALIMAPAGYRLGDYLPLGIPLTLLVMGITVFLAPLVFPF